MRPLDDSGTIQICKIDSAKIVKRFKVGALEYAQVLMRFEFSDDGAELFLHMCSSRLEEHNSTRVINIKSGKSIYERNDWRSNCGERIVDVHLLIQDKSTIVVATRTNGVFQADVAKWINRTPRQLFLPEGLVDRFYTAKLGQQRIAFVFSNMNRLDIVSLDNGKLRDRVMLPEGSVRAFSISPDNQKLAIVSRGNGGTNLIGIDLSSY